ncbi:MAG: hypothetical protein A2469_01070 [Candidatus Magasanikbacteria bacterium RIFOXYC2_FULL_40_16]|uniref:Endonuclease/exonuclease/phosphatase domain-containing protein n=1 Tax=Candidatus Magasanikbacteria bacterium RIFOXYC2_FULL_40_16 TaxID=1798703 RepID=A0A1F6NZQ1_9BACT|nr:MAG: hypothetical protein A2469_01070 [Candidatus Magasanikbacteria bacterium RIFOXYC2_FULL_40_16]
MLSKKITLIAALLLFCSGAISCQSTKYYVLKINTPTPKPIGETLKVVTYNIANARGNTDDFFYQTTEEIIRYNLDWIVKGLRLQNPDVICLNEVDFNSIRTFNIDQAMYIAKALSYKYIIKETIFSIPSVLQMGNVVLSKYPMKVNFHRQFGYGFAGRMEHVFKSFVDFDVLLDNSGHKLNFVLTHLDAADDDRKRCDEISILRAYLEKKTQPFVFLGDMNSGPGEKCFDNLFKWGLIGSPEPLLPTYPSDTPKRSIDHILVSKGLGIKNYRAIAGIGASDHLPVAGDIILK